MVRNLFPSSYRFACGFPERETPSEKAYREESVLISGVQQMLNPLKGLLRPKAEIPPLLMLSHEGT